MKKFLSFIVRVMVIVISFFAGAKVINYWWTNTSEDEESNQLKDRICKKHNLTLIDKNHNVYGEKRAVEIKSKTIHTMNKIGF